MITFRLQPLLLIVVLGLWLAGCGGQDANETNPESNSEAADAATSNGNSADQHEHGAEHADSKVDRAIAVMKPVGNSGISGTVEFVLQGKGVQVTGQISGLTPGEHGFHVHQYGNLTDSEKGQSAGGHFNPTNHPHGAPDAKERHVGDLGNIVANEQGVATIKMTDDVLQLSGPTSIIGRSLVVHAQPDQFTQPSGDAGDRIGFGVIGIAGPKE